MFFVYVLYSTSLHRRYIGKTENVDRRLSEHNNGLSTWTKKGIPWKLIYYEAYLLPSDATKRELFLKSGRGREYLDQLLNNSINFLNNGERV